MITENFFKDGHYIIESKLLGKLKVRFGVYGNTISSHRSFPWNDSAIREIKNQLDKIESAYAQLYVYMDDLNEKIMINGIPYNNISFEVEKWRSDQMKGLRVISRANRSDKSYSTEITDAARKVLEEEINTVFNPIFSSLAAECRRYAIQDYKASTQQRLDEAKQNILETENYLASLGKEVL